MNLRTVFSNKDRIAKALADYELYYLQSWPITAKLDLYNGAALMLPSSAGEAKATQMCVSIYNTLWFRWKLYRGGYVSHWDAAEVLKRMRSLYSDWGMKSSQDLRSLSVTRSREILLPVFEGFSGIKKQRRGDYPWVAASKFLHILNPRLFPIYDISVVWNVALNGRFKEDYVQFCRSTNAKPGERSALFNCTYTALAADMIQNSHSDLMPMFADWFIRQCVGYQDQHSLLDEVETFYATSFEIILVGATKL